MLDKQIEKPIKIIKFSQKNLIAQLIIFGILSGFIFYVGLGVLTLGGCGLMVIAYANYNMESIRFYQKHSEIKLRIFRSRHLIFDANVQSVEKTPNVLLLKVMKGDIESTEKIPLGYFSDDDKKEITSYYEQQVKKNELNINTLS